MSPLALYGKCLKVGKLSLLHARVSSRRPVCPQKQLSVQVNYILEAFYLHLFLEQILIAPLQRFAVHSYVVSPTPCGSSIYSSFRMPCLLIIPSSRALSRGPIKVYTTRRYGRGP